MCQITINSVIKHLLTSTKRVILLVASPPGGCSHLRHLFIWLKQNKAKLIIIGLNVLKYFIHR